MKRIVFSILLALITLWSSLEASSEKDEVVIGVLAFRSKEQTLQEWQPLGEYLHSQIPSHRFTIRPLTYQEFNDAAQRQELDFAFTNPEHYIFLSVKCHATRIATLIRSNMQGTPMREFGGVIVIPSGRNDISDLADLRDKKIAAVDPMSLGGFLSQSSVLLEEGIDVYTDTKVKFTDMPHDKVVYAVLSGQADAGFIRSGVLERMAAEGQIRRSDFRILHPQTPSGFPQGLSTPLYPEWPFASFQKTDLVLSNRVAVALLSIPYGSHVAQKAGYYGWSTPLAYEGIRILMEKMRVEPFNEAPTFTFIDVIEKYVLPIVLFLVSIIALLIFLAVRMQLLTRILRKKSAALEAQIEAGKEAGQYLKRAASVFHNSQEGIIITDADKQILDVNEAFTEITGYTREEAVGKKPSILRSGRHEPSFYSEMNRLLDTIGTWRGEIWNRKKSGEEYAGFLRIDAVKDSNGVVESFIGITSDITEDKKQQEQLQHLANYDPLTNLPNRHLFMTLAEQMLAFTKRKGSKAVIAFLDLDGFKEVNDSHGHSMGDRVLKKVGGRLEQQMRQSDTIARIGGDEFVIFLADIQNREDTHALLERILSVLKEPIVIEGLTLRVGASIGATFYPDDENDIDMLIRHADAAMYRSKEGGRNCITYYDPSVEAAVKAE